MQIDLFEHILKFDKDIYRWTLWGWNYRCTKYLLIHLNFW